jgi:hypothetical protein
MTAGLAAEAGQPFLSHDRLADRGSAIACKLNSISPQSYSADLLAVLAHRWPSSPIDALMPWYLALAKDD